jgi:hypothetical protein
MYGFENCPVSINDIAMAPSSRLASGIRYLDGRPTYLVYSPASRVGFSELFGGCFDGPLQPCFALLWHEGAPSPRPAC